MPTMTLVKEAKQTVRLALPLVIAQVAVVGMSVTDTLMAGRASSTDLAGVAIGTGFFIPVVVFVISLITGITPILAQKFGARDYKELGEATRQGIWLALILGVLASLLIQVALQGVQFVDAQEGAKTVAKDYLQVILFGLPGLAVYFALRSFCEAQGATRPTMYVNGAAFLLNIVLDYALVFGAFGLPKMGGVGCGIATALLHWLALGAFIIFSKNKRFSKAELYSKYSAPSLKGMHSIVRIGLPSSIGITGEATFFSMSSILVATLGVAAVSAHQITLNFGSLLFMIPLGIAQAVSIRIGHSIGESDLGRARYIGFSSIGLVAALGVITGLSTIILRDYIPQLYSGDPEIILMAAGLLIFCALFQVVDFVQIVSWGALRGFKDTKVPMYLQLISYWLIGFPVAYLLGFTDILVEPMGASGYWIGFIVGLTTAATLLGLRFYSVSRCHS